MSTETKISLAWHSHQQYFFFIKEKTPHKSFISIKAVYFVSHLKCRFELTTFTLFIEKSRKIELPQFLRSSYENASYPLSLYIYIYIYIYTTNIWGIFVLYIEKTVYVQQTNTFSETKVPKIKPPKLLFENHYVHDALATLLQRDWIAWAGRKRFA